MTGRSFSLGRDGEARWERLHAAYELSQEHGEIAVVTSDAHEVRDEVRRRIEAMGHHVLRLEPREGVIPNIHNWAQSRRSDEKVPVVWIEAQPNAPWPEMLWIETLVVLNQARDTLPMQGPCHVVLAGLRVLHDTARKRAPDLSSFIGQWVMLGDMLEPLPNDTTLTWMHLSDLHVGSENWQRDEVLQALVRDLPGLLRKRKLRPDLLFVTGDVANRGTKTEYDGAFVVLGEITRTLKLERREHVFLVPGNHDVDRSKIGSMARRDHASLLTLDTNGVRDATTAFFGNAAEFVLYGQRLSAWCSFTETFLGRARSVSPERPWRTDVIPVKGLPVGVLSLCTVWTSGADHEHGKLVFGEKQLHDMLAEARDGGARFVVALMHHPLSWLHPEEQSAIRGKLEREVDLVLHGHVHEAHSAVQIAAGSAHATLAAGAAYAGLGQDPYHGFSVTKFDTGSGKLEIHHFTWSTRSARWHGDGGVPGADDRGLLVVQLRTPISSVDETKRVHSHEILATRLRHAARKVYATVDFAGLGAGGPRRHVTLEQIFVPLRFKVTSSARTDPSTDIDLARLAAMLDENEHVVVLGDPGSGKSTLAKYLALRAAQSEDGLVPILLTVRNWLAEGTREELLEMAARQAGSLLSVRTDAQALEGLCEAGNALLIIDGIDEAADVRTRRDLRDRLHGFVARYPHVPVLVTSRVTGYHELPLNGDFDVFMLAPFDDDAIRDFVHRWYELIEDNPTERLRRRADLMHAFDIEPRAKELARNPLLATLIGMVHFSRAQLPGERAKLYGMIIELLLVTWPAERQREFAELSGAMQQPLLEKLALGLLEQQASYLEDLKERLSQQQREQQGLSLGDLGSYQTLSRPGAQILVDASTLETLLGELLQRQSPERSAHELRRQAQRWSRWLINDCGLLQEQEPDRIGFLHLSLMEYMAGRALLERHLSAGYEAVGKTVDVRSRLPFWRETLLLMLGSEAEKRELGQTVASVLLASATDVVQRWNACMFGLDLLREEVDLGSMREPMLAVTCTTAMELSPYAPLEVDPNERLLGSFRWENPAEAAWSIASTRLAQITSLSRRHGADVRRWLQEQVEHGDRDALMGILTIASEAIREQDLYAWLSTHPDRPRTIRTLLAFDDTHPVGRWARGLASREDWRCWARTMPLAGIVMSSFAAIGPKGPKNADTLAVWIIPLLIRAEWVASVTDRSASSFVLPSIVFWGINPIGAFSRLDVAMRGTGTGTGTDDSEARYPISFANEIARVLTVNGAELFARTLSTHTLSSLLRYVVWFFEAHFSRYFERRFPRNVANHSSREALGTYLTEPFVHGLVEDFWDDFDVHYHGQERIPNHRPSQPGSRLPRFPMSTHIRSKFPELLDCWYHRGESELATHGMGLSLLAETHAALFTSAVFTQPGELSILAELRIENRWLHLLSQPLFTHAGTLGERPDLHALLLTYGIIQYQTTWEWPDSHDWTEWFSGPPPEHWLPAHLWHVVRSIQNPEDPSHREQALACLDRNDWPELADGLREHMLVPTPPEILALYDRDEPSESSDG